MTRRRAWSLPALLLVLALGTAACGVDRPAAAGQGPAAAADGPPSTDTPGSDPPGSDTPGSDPPGSDPSPDEPADPTAVVPIDLAVTPRLPATATSVSGDVVEVTDVTRIVPLSGSLAELVVTLGLGDRVVARDVGATFPQVADLPVVTEGHDVSAEGVLSTRPTVVLADTSVGPPEALDAIRGAGIPVVVVDEAWSLADVTPRITAVADALGVPEAGAALVERTEAELAAARTATAAATAGPPPRVAFLYLRGAAGVYLLGGEGSGADAMIEAVGGVDAGTAAGLGSFTPITSEALIAAAPDVVLVMEKGLDSVGGVDGLVELPGIAQTPAGRGRRVVAMDDGLLLSFGPRTGAAVQLLGARLADLDVSEAGP